MSSSPPPLTPVPSPGKLQALEGNGTGETNWSQVDTIYPSNHGSHWNSDTVIPHDWAGRSGGTAQLHTHSLPGRLPKLGDVSPPLCSPLTLILAPPTTYCEHAVLTTSSVSLFLVSLSATVAASAEQGRLPSSFPDP